MSHSYTIYRYNPGTFLDVPFYDWRGHVFEALARHLSSQGMRVKIEEKRSFGVRSGHCETTQIAIPDSLAIIQNEHTGEYYTLDCHDWALTDVLELMVRDPRCKKILKCQYRPNAFKAAVYQKVRPWTYFDRFWPKNEQRFIADRDTVRTCDALYFRGADWGARGRILHELSTRGVLPTDLRVIDSDEYFRESAAHRVMLSLPGIADACNRDVECFGRGMCVLRPRLRTTFHNDLVPDRHYVSIDLHAGRTDPVEVAERIERRFRDVADDHAYLESVARSAARWYDENVRVDAAMRLTSRLLGLEPVEFASAAG